METNFHSCSTDLGDHDLAFASKAIADVAPGWSVELHQALPGEASLMLIPEDADDAIGPTFVLHHRAGMVRLDQYHWDTYSEIGAFGSLHEAVLAVRRYLAALATPSSILLH